LPWIQGLGNIFLLVCLLTSLEGNLGFVKKKSCWRMQSNRQHVNHSAIFERCVQLTLMVVMALPPHHLIRPFLPR